MRKLMLDMAKVATQNRIVAVIGAGPAGLFAARQIAAAGNQVITKAQIHILEGKEQEEAAYPGPEDFKYKINAEMLQAIGVA